MMIYYMTDKNLFWTSIFLLIGSIILIVIEALGEWNKTEAEKRRWVVKVGVIGLKAIERAFIDSQRMEERPVLSAAIIYHMSRIKGVLAVTRYTGLGLTIFILQVKRTL
jgi:hypothetical protein